MTFVQSHLVKKVIRKMREKNKENRAKRPSLDWADAHDSFDNQLAALEAGLITALQEKEPTQ